jgi:hypothetical protein
MPEILWPFGDLLLPACISADLVSAFAVIMSGVLPNIDVVGFPFVEVSQEKMMISAFDFTERDQIIWIEFQIGMQMEGSDMVDLYPRTLIATGHTGWFAESMFPFHSGPFGTACLSMPGGYLCSVVTFPGSALRPCAYSSACSDCRASSPAPSPTGKCQQDNDYKQKRNNYGNGLGSEINRH